MMVDWSLEEQQEPPVDSNLKEIWLLPFIGQLQCLFCRCCPDSKLLVGTYNLKIPLYRSLFKSLWKFDKSNCFAVAQVRMWVNGIAAKCVTLEGSCDYTADENITPLITGQPIPGCLSCCDFLHNLPWEGTAANSRVRLSFSFLGARLSVPALKI